MLSSVQTLDSNISYNNPSVSMRPLPCNEQVTSLPSLKSYSKNSPNVCLI